MQRIQGPSNPVRDLTLALLQVANACLGLGELALQFIDPLLQRTRAISRSLWFLRRCVRRRLRCRRLRRSRSGFVRGRASCHVHACKRTVRAPHVRGGEQRNQPVASPDAGERYSAACDLLPKAERDVSQDSVSAERSLEWPSDQMGVRAFPSFTRHVQINAWMVCKRQ